MNLLTRVLAMLLSATRAWWRRFAVATTAGKVCWGAAPAPWLWQWRERQMARLAAWLGE